MQPLFTERSRPHLERLLTDLQTNECNQYVALSCIQKIVQVEILTVLSQLRTPENGAVVRGIADTYSLAELDEFLKD